MRLPVARLVLAAAVVVMGGGVVWGFLYNREDAEREAEGELPVAASGRVLHRDDHAYVVLDSAARRQVGVVLAAAVAAARPPRLSAFGRVIGLDAITEARDRYANAEATQEQARASLAHTGAEYRRLALLHADSGMVSTSHLEEARAAYQADSAAEVAASRTLRSATAGLREDFGPVIGDWLRHDPPVLDSILAGGRVLLQVTLLPPGTLAAPPRAAAVILPSGERVPARFVSWASRADPQIQGQSFFCLATRAPGLLPGVSVEVQIQPAGPAAGDALVSQGAVVWYDGAPWVYTRGDGDELTRRRIRIEGAEPGLYQVAGLAAGEWVVVEGAGLVLSTELQPSIPADEDG